MSDREALRLDFLRSAGLAGAARSPLPGDRVEVACVEGGGVRVDVDDPAAGDPDSGVAPGTAFEDIPED